MILTTNTEPIFILNITTPTPTPTPTPAPTLTPTPTPTHNTVHTAHTVSSPPGCPAPWAPHTAHARRAAHLRPHRDNVHSIVQDAKHKTMLWMRLGKIMREIKMIFCAYYLYLFYNTWMFNDYRMHDNKWLKRTHNKIQLLINVKTWREKQFTIQISPD